MKKLFASILIALLMCFTTLTICAEEVLPPPTVEITESQ
jgi:hypothetical protein